VSTSESVEIIGPVQDGDKTRTFVNTTTDLRFPHKGRIFLPFVQILLTLRRLMSYIYGAPILDVSRSHTTTQHSR